MEAWKHQPQAFEEAERASCPSLSLLSPFCCCWWADKCCMELARKILLLILWSMQQLTIQLLWKCPIPITSLPSLKYTAVLRNAGQQTTDLCTSSDDRAGFFLPPIYNVGLDHVASWDLQLVDLIHEMWAEWTCVQTETYIDFCIHQDFSSADLFVAIHKIYTCSWLLVVLL